MECYIWRTKKDRRKYIKYFFGLLCTYLILKILAPENIEAIGDTIVVRHNSPAISQVTEIESYILPFITMVATVKCYWFILSKKALPKES